MDIQVLGFCRCGRQLATTFLKPTVERPLLAEAQMICGTCQSTFRFIVHEERGPHTRIDDAQSFKEAGTVLGSDGVGSTGALVHGGDHIDPTGKE